MSKIDFYKNEQKTKTEMIYKEISEELGISYPKVVACIRDGLFRYIKDYVFKEFLNIQLRGFGTFYISKQKLRQLNGKKQEEYDEKRGNNKSTETT